MIRSFWETARTLVYAVAIALVVRTFLFEPFNIPSGSMKPTLLIGDYLFISKYAYGYTRHALPFSLPLIPGRLMPDMPERGDVVVFKLPADDRTDYIKRVIGLPGDRIQMIDGILHLNGEPVPHEPAGDFVDEEVPEREIDRYVETLPNGKTYDILDLVDGAPLDDTGVYEVPPDHIFAMGDNRDNSQDSRTNQVGYVPVENLVGRAEIRFFSTNGDARLWQIWKWPWAIRYDRLLTWID